MLIPRMKAQLLHAASQLKQQTQQTPALTGPIGFIFGGLFNEGTEQMRETYLKKARLKKVPAPPRWSKRYEKKTKTRELLSCTPLARFNDDGNLIFTWHWNDVYRKRLSMFRNTPYALVPVYISKPEQEKTYCILYEWLQGTSKQEWMDEYESRNKRIRPECTRIAKNPKRTLISTPD